MLNIMLACLVSATSLVGSDDYLAGHNAARAGRYGDAVAFYSACAAKDGPLKAYAELRKAFCVGASGDRARAIEQYRAFLKEHPDGPWARMAQTYLAMLLAQDKQYEQAAPLFAESLSFSPKFWWVDTYDWAAADCFLHVPGMEALGRDYFRNVVMTTKLRARRLEAVSKIADSPQQADVLVAAFGLLKSADTGNAQRTLSRILPAQAKSYVASLDATKSQLNAEARKKMRTIADANTDAAWLPVWLAYVVRERAADHDTHTALEACNLLLKKCPNSEEAAYGLWWLGNRYKSDGKPDSAVKQYMRLVDHFPKHPLAADTLFDVAMVQRERHQTHAYMKTLTQLVTGYPECSQASNAWYWLGKAHEAAGHDTEAAKAYRKAVDCGIGNFYSHLALERLRALKQDDCPVGCDLNVNGTCFVRPYTCDAAPPTPLPKDTDYRLQRMNFFAQFGLEEAEWEALELTKDVNEEKAAVIYQALGEAGVAYTAMQHADTNGWDMTDGKPGIERLRVRWPRAYWQDVQKIANDVGIDPYLVLAVARQESTYRPALTSHAGASGVMQIMPGTARDIVKWEKFDAAMANDLENPMTSLRMGACYLVRMLERCDGNIAYALASYNAGPGNCSKWRNAFGGEDLETFIEQIPFDETRDYVKKVLGNYAAYYSLYPKMER